MTSCLAVRRTNRWATVTGWFYVVIVHNYSDDNGFFVKSHKTEQFVCEGPLIPHTKEFIDLTISAVLISNDITTGRYQTFENNDFIGANRFYLNSSIISSRQLLGDDITLLLAFFSLLL